MFHGRLGLKCDPVVPTEFVAIDCCRPYWHSAVYRRSEYVRSFFLFFNCYAPTYLYFYIVTVCGINSS